MTGGNSGPKLGSAYFEIEGKIEKLEAALAKARADVRDAVGDIDAQAGKVGQSFDRAGDVADSGLEKVSAATDEARADVERLEREIEQLRAEMRKLETQADQTGDSLRKNLDNKGGVAGTLASAGKAASRLQAAFSKLLIPVALVTAIGGVVERLKQARREADQLRDSFSAAADAAKRSARDAELSGRVPDHIREQQRVLEGAQQAAAEIQAQTEAYLDRNDNLLRSLTLRMVGRSLDGTVREADRSSAELFKQAGREVRALRENYKRDTLAALQDEIDAFNESRLTDMERIDKEERERIAQARQLMAEADTQAEREKYAAMIGEIQRVYAYERDAIDRNHAQQLQNTRERAAAETESIERRAVLIERSLMKAADARRAELQDDLRDVRGRIDEVRRDGIDTNTGEDKQLEALARLERAILAQTAAFERQAAQTTQAQRELPEIMERANHAGTRRALEETGLLQTPMTLAAIRQNLERFPELFR